MSIRNLLCKPRLVLRRGKTIETFKVSLISYTPGSGESLRVVGGAPGLGESQVEVAVRHIGIPFVSCHQSRVDGDANFREIRHYTAFDCDRCGVT